MSAYCCGKMKFSDLLGLVNSSILKLYPLIVAAVMLKEYFLSICTYFCDLEFLLEQYLTNESLIEKNLSVLLSVNFM